MELRHLDDKTGGRVLAARKTRRPSSTAGGGFGVTSHTLLIANLTVSDIGIILFMILVFVLAVILPYPQRKGERRK